MFGCGAFVETEVQSVRGIGIVANQTVDDRDELHEMGTDLPQRAKKRQREGNLLCASA